MLSKTSQGIINQKYKNNVINSGKNTLDEGTAFFTPSNTLLMSCTGLGEIRHGEYSNAVFYNSKYNNGLHWSNRTEVRLKCLNSPAYNVNTNKTFIFTGYKSYLSTNIGTNSIGVTSTYGTKKINLLLRYIQYVTTANAYKEYNFSNGTVNFDYDTIDNFMVLAVTFGNNGKVIAKLNDVEVCNGTIADFSKWNLSFNLTGNGISVENGIDSVYIYEGAMSDSDLTKLYKKLTMFCNVDGFSGGEEICIQEQEEYDLSRWYSLPNNDGIIKNSLILDKTIAKINSSGKIVGLKKGTTYLILGANAKGKRIKVTVGKQVSDTAIAGTANKRNIVDISIVNPISEMKVGDEHPLWAILLDDTEMLYDMRTDDNLVTVETSNSKVIACNFGSLLATGTGTATITVRDLEKTIQKSFVVSVSKAVTYDTENIYTVTLSDFNLTSNGTIANGTYSYVSNGIGSKNVAAIQNALNFAKTNGYKKIVFPNGIYTVNGDAGTIQLPSNLIIDFSGSVILLERGNNIQTSTAYTMFEMLDAENCILMNVKMYAENYNSSTKYHLEHELTLNIKGKSHNSACINCEFSYAPGFNVFIDMDWVTASRTALKLTNIEQGTMNADGTKGTAKASHYRTIDYISTELLDTNKQFGLGNCQGYCGYMYMASRFYDLCCYDANKSFLGKMEKLVQFCNYDMISGTKYVMVEFFQKDAPTACDPDFGGIAHFYSVSNPRSIKFINCTFKDNVSTGLCPQGGIDMVVDGCTFNNSGSIDPHAAIDWEDGGQNISGHVIRNCYFEKTDAISNITSVKSRNLVFRNNIVKNCNLDIRVDTENMRVFNNVFTDVEKILLNSKTDMVYAKNISNVKETVGTTYGECTIFCFDNIYTEDILVQDMEFVNTLNITTFKTSDKQLFLNVFPRENNEQITFSTSDSSIATIDSSYQIIAPKNNGTFKVIATASKSGKTCECNCTVNIKKVTSITFDITELELLLTNKTAKITPTVLPTDNADTFTWSSSNTGVCTVNSTGALTPVAVGSCVITYKSNFSNVSQICNVVVKT